jgi:hypothetical protein
MTAAGRWRNDHDGIDHHFDDATTRRRGGALLALGLTAAETRNQEKGDNR